MTGYSLLEGVRVLEVSLLAPDSAGQHLADLGAEVIKIEQPPNGDHVRHVSPTALGSPNGLSLMHLTYNRGKRSVALDLQKPAGRDVFLDLAQAADVVIEGVRAGSLARWGLAFEVLQRRNPKLVMCSLSGFGSSGPYRTLPTHGVAFDAYAGLVPSQPASDGSPRLPERYGSPVGITAGGLQAALAILAAVISARHTGRGTVVEVAEADAAALWWKEGIEWALNGPLMHTRSTYSPSTGSGPSGLRESVRYQYYQTADERIILFMAVEAKFFENFCRAVGRPDLLERYAGLDYDQAAGNEQLRAELQRIFRERTRAEWIDLFLAANVPGSPVNSPEELASDRHFNERGSTYQVEHPELGTLRLTTTPIKVRGQAFAASPAPSCGQDTEEVLGDILGLDEARLTALRREGVIG